MKPVHPAAELFPLMEGAEFAAFVEDVRTHGFREPAWLDKAGRILDGRNRARAAKETGRTLTWRTYDGDDPIGFVLSLNAARRNMTPSQLAAVAAEATAMYEAEAAKGGRPKKDEKPSPDRDEVSAQNERRSTAKAAKATGASRTSTAKAKRVMEADPVLHEQVKAGKVKVDAAEKEVVWRQAVEQYPFLEGIPEKLRPEFLGGVKQLGTFDATEREHRVEMLERHADAAKRPPPEPASPEEVTAGAAGEAVHQLAAQAATKANTLLRYWEHWRPSPDQLAFMPDALAAAADALSELATRLTTTQLRRVK